MEMKPNNDQTESQEPEVPEASESEPQEPTAPETNEQPPQSKTWQEYATQFLNLLKDWFLKLKTSFKIIVLLFIVAILVLILLAYLGVFGQELANLIKQLVNKIMEMVGTKKS